MSAPFWRLLDLEDTDPYLNVALEEAIMKCVGKKIVPCSLRFWRNATAVIIGSFQCAELEVDPVFCQRNKIPVIRRISGGGAVYHDLGNLNYSLFVTKDHSFDDVYHDTSSAVVQTLHSMNVDAVQVSRNMITFNERKISGLAGARKNGASLIHGSLLINANLELLSDVLGLSGRLMASDDGRRKYVRSKKMDVINLADALRQEICLSQIKSALQQSFENVFSIKFVQRGLSGLEKSLVNELYAKKYCSDDWNFKYRIAPIVRN